MEEAFNEFAGRMFVGPVWPASILVCLMVLYTLVAVIGLIDLDLEAPDVDLGGELGTPDLDGIDLELGGGDVEIGQPSSFEMVSGLAATTIRWTNFGRVPLVIWLGVFTVVFWTISYGLWHRFDATHYQPDWWPSFWLAGRNAVLAVIATKFITRPVVGKFQPPPGYDQRRLLGATCEISSITADPTYGQARFRTNAAPLLLNVRTDGEEIAKGTEVRIIDFDPVTRIYTVTEIKPENVT